MYILCCTFLLPVICFNPQPIHTIFFFGFPNIHHCSHACYHSFADTRPKAQRKSELSSQERNYNFIYIYAQLTPNTFLLPHLPSTITFAMPFCPPMLELGLCFLRLTGLYYMSFWIQAWIQFFYRHVWAIQRHDAQRADKSYRIGVKL